MKANWEAVRKYDFRLDFYRRNPKGALVSDCVIEVRLRIAHLFERLHFITKKGVSKMKNVLGNQRGLANIEVMIILGCFVIITLVASVAMFGQGGQGTQDIADVIEEASNHIEAEFEDNIAQALEDAAEVKETLLLEVCESLCEADYNAGVNNVTQYANCISGCSE